MSGDTVQTIYAAFYAAGLLAALVALVAAALSDFRTMTIPNLWPLVIAAGFVVSFSAALLWERAGGPAIFAGWGGHAVAFALMLGMTFVMFVAGLWGAGDSKLASALALWLGLAGVMPFLMLMALAGLVLVVIGTAWRRNGAHAERIGRWAGPESWPLAVSRGEKSLPYGIAIAAGAVIAFAQLGYFSVL